MFKNETLPPAISSTAINSTAINSRFPLRDEHNIVALQEPHAANDAKSGSNLLESVCLVLVSGHFVSFIQHDEKLFYLIIRILNSIFFHSQRCQSRSGGRNRRTGELEHSTTVTIVGWAHDIEPLLNRGAEYWVSQNTIADSLYIQYVAASYPLTGRNMSVLMSSHFLFRRLPLSEWRQAEPAMTADMRQTFSH